MDFQLLTKVANDADHKDLCREERLWLAIHFHEHFSQQIVGCDTMSESTQLDCKDLYGFLNTLPSSILDRLYDHPFTCLAVFRGLKQLGKSYVLRTLFLNEGVPETFVSTWTKKENIQAHKDTLTQLKGLRIWRESSSGPANSTRYEMNASFRSNLRIAICGGGRILPDTSQYGEDKHARDTSFLHTYAKERWESVIYFMTGSTQATDGSGVSQDIVNILISSKLLNRDGKESTTSITSQGFQFLLLETSAQVWHFMLQYLITAEQRKMDTVECLSFLFQISFSTFGKDYPVENLTETQLNFLQHLREIGLVFQRKRKSRRFYPTQLAISLGSAVTGSTVIEEQKQGYLIFETNYRLYAYTTSDLQVALLSLFCDVHFRFPNLCVCVISRESVQQALATGITSQQILNFLVSRAHPQLLSQSPIVPSTLSDQVRLWEIERDRLRYTDGVLYNQFLSQSDFETLRKYADDLSVLMWTNINKRLMVVTKEGHDDVRRFWKKHRQGSSN